MKPLQTSIFAIVAFFLSTGISFGAELDDLDLTIRVVESDELAEVHNELSLPDVAADVAREHAEDDDGRGLTQADESHAKEHEEDDDEDMRKDEKEYEDEAREEREDETEDHDEAREDGDDVIDEHDEAQEEETHEEEHEKHDDNT